LSPALLVEVATETCGSSFPDLGQAFSVLKLEYDGRNNDKMDVLLQEILEIAERNNEPVTRSDALAYFRIEAQQGFGDVFPRFGSESERRDACDKFYLAISRGEVDLKTMYTEEFTRCLRWSTDLGTPE